MQKELNISSKITSEIPFKILKYFATSISNADFNVEIKLEYLNLIKTM